MENNIENKWYFIKDDRLLPPPNEDCYVCVDYDNEYYYVIGSCDDKGDWDLENEYLNRKKSQHCVIKIIAWYLLPKRPY